MRSRSLLLGLVLGLLLLPSPHAKATFHEMQIYQVIGGVNGDTSVQAIELRMRDSGQNFLSNRPQLVAVDATGANPITLINFTTNVNIGNQGSSILITTDNFGSHTDDPADFTNDFSLQNTIPASYLAAGRLLYEDASGDILWSLAFGGANYTGPTNGETTNGPDDPGKFGGSLPSGGAQSLLYQGDATGQNAHNATDYALSDALFTNNNGDTFGVVVPEPGTWTLLFSGITLVVVLRLRVRRHEP
jgi:hypothetical protein